VHFGMTDPKLTGAAKPKISRVEVYWHTVTYRTVIMLVLIVVAVVLIFSYLVFPETFGRALHRATDALERRTASVAQGSQRQARFVNLDGRVQIKKVSSVQWTAADYQTPLDKGDLIQTGPDGVARVAFADGTTYTVKAETLVTVEENLVPQDQASRVGVHISSGAVDLATGTWEMPGSKAEVSFENAVASLRANSRAAVRTDPRMNEHEITVSSGAAELQRGDEHIELAQSQKAAFPTGGPVTRSDVLAPPQLMEPVNLQPIIVADPKHTAIRFQWQPVPTATAYVLQVSNTAMFTRVLGEKRTTGTTAELTGLDAGDYFWTVEAVDPKKNTSEKSDFYKFSLVAEAKAQEMRLEVDSTELHGSVVEVFGHTEPGAALIINGQEVADIRADGSFRYFTEPMSRGSHMIVITGQNRRGGTAIKRVSIVIP
jgi:hypothetical protein